MFDIFTLDNFHDFRQRYANTFGYFYPDGDTRKIPVMLTEINSRAAVMVGLYGEKYVVYPNSGLKFEFVPIDKGFKQCGDKVYHLCRHPDRQWQRGISASNTRIHQIVGDQLVEQPWSFDLIVNLFKPQPESSKDTFAPVVLSKEFALSFSYVWFFDMAVGYRDQNVLKLTNQLVGQELTDVIARNNLPYEVKAYDNH